MHRRTFLVTAAAATGATVLAAPAFAARQLSLDEISNYLRRLGTVRANFAQLTDDGHRSNGTLYMQRPGRARFEYSDQDVLMMASGGQVGIFDGGSNSRRAERYPLSRTPLHLFLERNPNLADRSMVYRTSYANGLTSVFARDPKNPSYGSIELRFESDPIRLKEWVVTDGTGSRTKVALGQMQEVNAIPSSLFSITYEEQRRGVGSRD